MHRQGSNYILRILNTYDYPNYVSFSIGWKKKDLKKFTEIKHTYIHIHIGLHIVRRKFYQTTFRQHVKTTYVALLFCFSSSPIYTNSNSVLSPWHFNSQITYGTISVDFRIPKWGKLWQSLTLAKLLSNSSDHIPSFFALNSIFWKQEYKRLLCYKITLLQGSLK